jgi:type IV secretion system protein VirB11
LILEAVSHVPRPLVAETIQVIAVLTGRGAERRLSELVRVQGLGSDGAYRLHHLHRDQGALP